MTVDERFEHLIASRDDEFESQRKVYFADRESVAYLAERVDDPDPVTAFVARELHVWATGNSPEIGDLDGFLVSGVSERKQELERTAAGWQPARELSRYLALRNNRQLNDYLLLRLLMTPKSSPTWMYGGALSYFANHPVGEPAVWIRKALEFKDDAVFDHLANLSLRLTDKPATLRALSLERARCARLKQPFPPQLEALRKELLGRH